MTDFWSFLLQTLTASGAAAALLLIKALFRDKLSPRWQCGVWALLGLTLLLPAGRGGRYVLFNWPLLVETAKTAFTGDYDLIRVTAPIPLPGRLGGPRGVFDALYLLYMAGVVALLAWYALTYLRLRLALRRGTPADDAQLRRVAERYNLPVCRAVEVEGLSSAFVCGFFAPVLALPAGRETDEKVLLHELLHRTYGDVGWGLLVCLFRCVHWCNPLLWYAFDQVQNDLEALCDQRVLERLEGEDRRDYGRILLSMADEKYARAPGTSSMANGGQNIKRRIASIARFKRYPAGMALASVCVAVILALPLALGTTQTLAKADGLGHSDQEAFLTAMASARLTRCTTPAGALDAYGKAVLDCNGIYRALCAPLEQHPALAAEMEAAASGPDHWVHERWESGLPGYPNVQAGYYIYNLTPAGKGAYTALMVFPLQRVYGVEDAYSEESNWLWTAVQTVRVWASEAGWVVEPAEDFRQVKCQSIGRGHEDGLTWGDEALPPAVVYTAETELYRLELRYQTVHMVDNATKTEDSMSWFSGPAFFFDTKPKPRAVFREARQGDSFTGTFLGSEEELRSIHTVRWSAAPMDAAGHHPDLGYAALGNSGGSSSSGAFWGCKQPGGMEEPWDGSLFSGGGSGLDGDPNEAPVYPAAYRLELSINGETETLTLTPREGGAA